MNSVTFCMIICLSVHNFCHMKANKYIRLTNESGHNLNPLHDGKLLLLLLEQHSKITNKY